MSPKKNLIVLILSVSTSKLVCSHRIAEDKPTISSLRGSNTISKGASPAVRHWIQKRWRRLSRWSGADCPRPERRDRLGLAGHPFTVSSPSSRRQPCSWLGVQSCEDSHATPCSRLPRRKIVQRLVTKPL